MVQPPAEGGLSSELLRVVVHMKSKYVYVTRQKKSEAQINFAEIMLNYLTNLTKIRHN